MSLHEVSFRAKCNIFISVSGQFLITVYITQPEMRLIAVSILFRSFWQKWNFISGDKLSCNTTRNEIIRKEASAHAFYSSKQEWLAFTEWAVFLGTLPKWNFISFCPQWKAMLAKLILLWTEIPFLVDIILGLI